MVIGARILDFGARLLLAIQQSAEPVLQQLDPPRRAAVIMALLALTLIGLFLILFIMVGGHWVRRMARHRPGQRRAVYNPATIGQLPESLQAILPEIKTGDTVLVDTPSRDTKTDK